MLTTSSTTFGASTSKASYDMLSVSCLASLPLPPPPPLPAEAAIVAAAAAAGLTEAGAYTRSRFSST